MKKDCFRHGDVILVPKKVPEKAEEQKTEKIVLAYGEVTGHSHAITKGAAALFKHDEKTFLRIQDEIAELDHEEHGCLQIPQGDYEIIIQRDYEPEGWKNVQD